MPANPKPAKGTARAELLKKRARIRAGEQQAKAVVKARDGGACRVPGCGGVHLGGWAFNVAHLEHKGIGGDKTLDRTKPEKMIGLCFAHHLGTWSLDSGHLKIQPDTPDGTNGPCRFWVSKDLKDWTFLGLG